MKSAIFLVFAFAFFPLASFADSLTVYVIPSAHGTNWNSPRDLARSVLQNHYLSRPSSPNHETGNMWIHLQCSKSQTAQPVDVWTGVTGGSDELESELVHKTRLGLGLLFYVFKGHLQSPSEIEANLENRFLSGVIHWVQFSLNESTCARLSRFYSEFRANRLDRKYGLSLRPRYKEGASAASYAMAFVELAGLIPPEVYHSWHLTKRVPLSLLGDSENPVGLVSIFVSSSSSRWASASEEAREISFWDPDTAFKWIRNRVMIESLKPTGRYKVQTRYKAKGLYLDGSKMKTPTDSIWLL